PSPLPAFNSSGGPQPLPPFNFSSNQAGTVDSSIAINDPTLANQVVSSLAVTLNITSSFDPDLILTLIAPDGTRIVLARNVGFGTQGAVNFSDTTFDSVNGLLSIAARRHPAGYTSHPSPPFQGLSFVPYLPQGALGSLKGQSINGTWTLEIRNSGFGSTTTFNNCSLSIT